MHALTNTFSGIPLCQENASSPFAVLDKRILIICQSQFALYQEAFSDLQGYQIYVISCRTDENPPEGYFVFYVNEYFEAGEVEKVAFHILKTKPCRFLIALSETDILRAAKLRSLYNITGQKYESAIFFRDKCKMKTALKAKGIAVPHFAHVASAIDLLAFTRRHSYPLIIKPSRGYGSQRTLVLRNDQDVEKIIDTKGIFDEFHQADLEVEEFIDGAMYHVDGIVREGMIAVIWPSKCINTCLDMLEGKPTGGYLLSPQNPLIPRIKEFALKILEALPTPAETGFHLELFIKDDQLIFCEIASRIGGPWINDLWIEGFGINLKKEFIRAQAGLRLLPHAASPNRLIGGMIFPPQPGIVDAIPNECPISAVLRYSPLITKGDLLQKPDSMLGHIASFVLSANSEEEMLQTINRVHDWFISHLIIA